MRKISILLSIGLLSLPAHAQDAPDLKQALARSVSREQAATVAASCPANAGLTEQDGRAAASTLLDDMAGFAKIAGTTGGIGQQIFTVTNPNDGPPPFGKPAPPGSLRDAVEQAKKAGGGWIVFSPALGPRPRIDLARTIRLPSNTTLDGGCTDVTITTQDPYAILVVGDGAKNVILARLNLEQRPPIVSEDGDCITVAHEVDRVWIAHNRLRRCGDGLIDIVQKNPGPAARITVAFNRFEEHDKDMGIGNCPPSIPQPERCDDVTRMPWSWDRGLQVTLQENLFNGTGGRHPRMAGLLYVHMVDNVVAYARSLRSNGKYGIAYGAYVGGGARLLAQNDLFVSLEGPTAAAILSAETPGASAGGKDGPGSMRLENVRVLGGAKADQQHAELTPPPPYDLKPKLDFDRDPWKAAACLADRVGPSPSSKCLSP